MKNTIARVCSKNAMQANVFNDIFFEDAIIVTPSSVGSGEAMMSPPTMGNKYRLQEYDIFLFNG